MRRQVRRPEDAVGALQASPGHYVGPVGQCGMERALVPPLQALAMWAERHGPELDAAERISPLPVQRRAVADLDP